MAPRPPAVAFTARSRWGPSRCRDENLPATYWVTEQVERLCHCHPLSRPAYPRLSPAQPEAPRALSTHGAPTAVAFQTRSDFHRWIPSAPPLAGAEGATEGPPLLPWLCRLGPASEHAFTRIAASQVQPPSRLFTGATGPRAVHRLLQLYGLPSTTSNAETPPYEHGGKPPHGGWCRSCETSPAEFVQPRVRLPHEEACDAAATSVTPLRFVPNLSYLRHPLSLTSTRRRLEQATVGDHTDPDARRRRAWPLPAPFMLPCRAP